MAGLLKTKPEREKSGSLSSPLAVLWKDLGLSLAVGILPVGAPTPVSAGPAGVLEWVRRRRSALVLDRNSTDGADMLLVANPRICFADIFHLNRWKVIVELPGPKRSAGGHKGVSAVVARQRSRLGNGCRKLPWAADPRGPGWGPRQGLSAWVISAVPVPPPSYWSCTSTGGTIPDPSAHGVAAW